MIALSVAKLKIFKYFSLNKAKKEYFFFFAESLGQRRRLEEREKERNVFCDDPTSV